VGVEVGANCGLLRVIGSGEILYTTHVSNGILDNIIIIIINKFWIYLAKTLSPLRTLSV
jgi:hypothetical protein